METHIICHLCHIIYQHTQEHGRYFSQDLFLLEWQQIHHLKWSLELYDVQCIKEKSVTDFTQLKGMALLVMPVY